VQTPDRYLARKNSELAYLDGLLAVPLGLPPARSVHQVIQHKLKLRARLLAQGFTEHPDLLETNFRPGRERHLGSWRLRYLYQRFDTQVDGPPVYPALLGDDAPPLIRGVQYFSSGMGAISAVLLALERLDASPVQLCALRDCYFETVQLLQRLPRSLRPVLARDHRELSKALEQPHQGRRALLLDSISVEDPSGIPMGMTPGSVDLLLVDGTCWGVDSPRFLQLARATSQLGVPVIFLRSHQKLDFLGVEYGRLGSAVFLASPMAPAVGHQLTSALHTSSATMARLLGSAMVPGFLVPCAGDPAFLALNRRRQDGIRAANHRAAELLAPLNPATYHHQLFLTLQPYGENPVAQGTFEVEVEALAATAAQEGLAVRRATSFGFDFTALTVFPDADSGQACLRVAFADLSDHQVESACELIARWMKRQAGR